MTQRDLTTGITARRVKRVVGVSAQYIMLIAALSGAPTHAAYGQRSLVAIALPSDTSGMLRILPPTPPKSKSAFAQTQLQNARVLEARIAKRLELKKVFRDRGIAYPAAEIFMRVFKREHQLEMWVRPEGVDTFALLKTYEICALNDLPGPKRVQGDERTPEGFYYIDNFNPQSGYYLSLRVNYPNESDVALGKGHMGGDVFIHGGCKTAGCVAVTNENIKEIYWLAVEARDNGQTRIPVHIFPARLHDNGLRLLANVFEKQPDLVRFWSNLKGGFDYFDQFHKLPTVDVNNRGRYVFNSDPSKPALLGKTVTPTTDSLAVPPQQ